MTSPLRCAPNFRDLGGIPARNGLSVKPGLLYRSETLIDAGRDDRQWLEQQSGIACVIDLRTELERAQQGGYWLTQERVPVLHMPMKTDVRAAARKIGQLMEANKPIPATDVLELLCGVSPDWLTAAFDSARNAHGSIDNYLSESGADAALRARLQARLLV